MFACIYVIVGFKSSMQLMLFVKCIYVPTLNKIYLTFYWHGQYPFPIFVHVQSPDFISSMFNDLNLEVVVRSVNIGRIVNHHRKTVNQNTIQYHEERPECINRIYSLPCGVQVLLHARPPVVWGYSNPLLDSRTGRK